MTTPLTLSTEHRDDDTATVVAAGEIDLSNVHDFTDALHAAIADGGGLTVAVDLGAVDYLDSAAINTLFGCVDQIAHIIANPLLMPALTITGLTERTTIHPTRP